MKKWRTKYFNVLKSSDGSFELSNKEGYHTKEMADMAAVVNCDGRFIETIMVPIEVDTDEKLSQKNRSA